MSVKGRKSRQAQQTSRDHGYSLKAIFKSRRTVDREHFPAGKNWEAGRARQLLADALAQASADLGAAEAGLCAGCGLEPWAWLGNHSEGYVRDSVRYCCQGCAERRVCPCQG
jgi:hypothetical protein